MNIHINPKGILLLFPSSCFSFLTTFFFKFQLTTKTTTSTPKFIDLFSFSPFSADLNIHSLHFHLIVFFSSSTSSYEDISTVGSFFVAILYSILKKNQMYLILTFIIIVRVLFLYYEFIPCVWLFFY